MRSSRIVFCIIALVFVLLLGACAKSSESQPSALPTRGLTNGTTLLEVSGDNVLPLTINGATCSGNAYPNKPCVTVKVCAPGDPSNCQVIDDIVLDTGSSGLRLFKSVVNPTLLSALPVVVENGQPLAECAQYGDGTSHWGPIQQALVVLGNEPAVQVSIQIVDAEYAKIPSTCSNPENDPTQAGMKGLLGVGLFVQDCGLKCARLPNSRVYFTCSGSGSDATCTGTLVPRQDQVQNPAALLPLDNNGVIIELPQVPIGGSASAAGYAVLGIGTRSNNQPSGVTLFPVDPAVGEFKTSFDGKELSSFLDTGSNGLYFPTPISPGSPKLPDCAASNSHAAGFYCPSGTVNLSAITTGMSGTPSTVVPFSIGNLISLANTPNWVFSELGGSASIGGPEIFDWGLPFHLGRNVYVGIEGTSSSLGVGPYWAY